MNYYLLYPEIAGELGEASEVIYESGRIREVTFLEYNFMGWQGDELLSTHPCFIVTNSLKNDIKSNEFSGVFFKRIKMTFSDEFYDLSGNLEVPQFVEMVCEFSYEENLDNLQHDFYFNEYKELVVSERALTILKQHKMNCCVVQRCI